LNEFFWLLIDISFFYCEHRWLGTAHVALLSVAHTWSRSMNAKLQAVTLNNDKVARKRKDARPTVPDPLRNFDCLPGEAFVRLPVVLMLLGVSRSTVWRWCESGALPAPKKLGSRICVWRVRDLREVLKAGSL
jgi:predicted DNA-binding transcriptional regulator AlpA